MVVFTCNHCGETLQKPKVAKHYEFQCRTAPFLTCVDCFKDFRGEEYVAHTKCITEAERYGGKDYVPKARANKGERKQQEWINIVSNILNSVTNLTNAERSFLNMLSKYENIPRKKARFLNFVKSAIGHRANPAIVDSVWDKMESAYKNNVQTAAEKQQQQQQNGNADHKVDEEHNVSEHQENNIIENQNNENISRENQNDDQNKSNNDAEINTPNSISKKKNKSKKRKISETVEEQIAEPVLKKKRKSIASDDQTEEIVPKKKTKNGVLSESLVAQCDEEQTNEKSAFDWKGTILHIVQSKEEISLKKLQKKVTSQFMNFCSHKITNEKALAKFNKKLKKVPGILIADEKVKLA
ncbi:PREDICTED: cell growth-regulating nucleolar protein [Dufourea novaeangliae]|uniref:Cell growth-regulating nucleolar protein n=1 Tax=Dufourea novaeangliae TaxID=178035 RepID=A0A154NYX8_DUFNO|nr:PREDICTED: cell growth-regulating nucleolar protein [Dufourea novaeangliae]KZC04823.1 Cell growth-regulating nucleolar protein [Dufourea novaeangliae]